MCAYFGVHVLSVSFCEFKQEILKETLASNMAGTKIKHVMFIVLMYSVLYVQEYYLFKYRVKKFLEYELYQESLEEFKMQINQQKDYILVI